MKTGGPLGFVLVCCGAMLGSGLGAAYGSVPLGLLGGVAVGGLVAVALSLRKR